MPSILIIRLSAIGDVVMASPLIKAVRRTWPDAHIAWLAQPEVRELLEANPDLDEVIVWPKGEWKRLWKARRWLRLVREIRGFVRTLRARRFDIAVDPQGLLKSGIWAFASGAPRRLGIGSREGSARLMTEVVPKAYGDPRIGSEYLLAAETLGLETAEFRMDVALTTEDRAFAERFIGAENLSGGFTVLCPFTTRPQKHWFEERWRELAARLYRERGLTPVILGGPGDREAAERMIARADVPLLHLAGKTRLREAAAVIERAALLVGVDTGLTHMAPAFDTPSVALFGATCPYLDTTRPRSVVLYHKQACSPCRRNPTCNDEFPCMRLITTDEVMRTIESVLK